jgi:hypothetical protein
MKSSLAWTIAAITLASAPAAARAQDQSKPTEPAHKTTLLTGCLQPGSDAATFKLTHASPSQPPSVKATTSVSAAAIGKTRDYDLTSDPSSKTDLKLSTYIGARVEVTARPIDSAPAASSGRAVAGLTAEPKEHEPQPERLMVTAITRVSASCP